MLALTTKSLVRQWRRTTIIELTIVVPLVIFGAVYPISLASFSQLQAYSTFTAGYVVVDTQSYFGGSAPTIYISNQNISSMQSINGVRDVYGILNVGFLVTLGPGIIAELKSNCNMSVPPPQPGIKNLDLGGTIIAFNTTAVRQSALPYQVLQGRFPETDESDAVAISDQTQKCTGWQVGDTFSTHQALATAGSMTTEWENATLHIVGVYATPSSGANPTPGAGNMPEGIMGVNAALARFPIYSGRYSLAWVVVSDVRQVSSIGSEIRSMFPNYRVYYPGSLIQETISVLNIASATFNIISYLAIISAALVIFLMRFFDLQGRLPELGLYLSQGWKFSDVSKHEYQLSVLQGTIGGALAVPLGFLLRNFTVELLGLQGLASGLSLQVSYYAITAAVIVAVALAFSLASSYFGLRRLKKRMPIELLRR